MKLYVSVLLSVISSVMIQVKLIGFDTVEEKWNHSLNFNKVEKRLKSEEVISISRLQKYLREQGFFGKAPASMKLVVLESGLKAVFKPGDSCYAEVAGYKASRHLGLRLVPPAVVRTIKGTVGSLQLLVPSTVRTDKTSMMKLSHKDQCDIPVFCFVFGQWDTHNGNRIISQSDGDFSVALIDNAAMMHVQKVRHGDYAFIKKGEDRTGAFRNKEEPFPFDQVKIAFRNSYHDLYPLFEKFVPRDVIERMEHKKKVAYVIWNNALWVQPSRFKRYKPSVTKTYYASTLRALKKLDRESLYLVWKDARDAGLSCDELIDLILERRDQLVAVAEATGVIVDDLPGRKTV
ncbi:hypothetical protein H0X06_04575 [Candidatus Dependentiae bacterium]|nr:hypothetical protein [Candidatus Dependentiae bacterium]